MSAIEDGGPAYPAICRTVNGLPLTPGISIRDYFAIRAPYPTRERIEIQMQFDRGRNPHNDSYKPPLRSEVEIVCDLSYEYADAMLKARES